MLGSLLPLGASKAGLNMAMLMLCWFFWRSKYLLLLCTYTGLFSLNVEEGCLDWQYCPNSFSLQMLQSGAKLHEVFLCCPPIHFFWCWPSRGLEFQFPKHTDIMTCFAVAIVANAECSETYVPGNYDWQYWIQDRQINGHIIITVCGIM